MNFENLITSADLAKTMEWGTEEQIEEQNRVCDTYQMIASTEEFDAFENYAHKATVDEMMDYIIKAVSPIEIPREEGTPLKTVVTSNDKESWIAIVYEAIGCLGIDFDEPSQDELNTALAWLAEECGVEDIVDFLESRGR